MANTCKHVYQLTKRGYHCPHCNAHFIKSGFAFVRVPPPAVELRVKPKRWRWPHITIEWR